MIKKIEKELKDELDNLFTLKKDDFIKEAKKEFETESTKAKKIIEEFGSLEKMEETLSGFEERIKVVTESFSKEIDEAMNKLTELDKKQKSLNSLIKEIEERVSSIEALTTNHTKFTKKFKVK